MNKKQRRDKMIEKRRAYWAEKRPNWLKEPVARIEGALKFIHEQTREVVQTGKGWVWKNSPVGQHATNFARAGDGAAVNALALRVLTHGK